MCGIAGIISRNPNNVYIGILSNMNDVLVHRGPDGHNEWICPKYNNVGLAHRRLAIIDLSHNANQPMCYLRRYWITFNGEIYNYIELKNELKALGYTFSTESDTEVLLAMFHEFGHNFLDKVDGMFAFAIYDQEKREIFIARDIFGEKPFYFYHAKETFIFASEIKAIHAAGICRDFRESFVYNYIQYGAINNPGNDYETFYKGISKLPKGHYMLLNTVDLSFSVKKYFQLNSAAKKYTKEEAKETLFEILRTSVTRRLRSDVSVGSSLSGGLDSSIIVALINEMWDHNTAQFTFSAVFPGFAKNEEKYQDIVVKNLENINQRKIFPSSESFINNLSKLLYHQEEPFISTSVGAQFEVFESIRDNGVIVALDGQGADELFAGYHDYYKSYFTELRSGDRNLFMQELKSYNELMSDNQINTQNRTSIVDRIKISVKSLVSSELIRSYYAKEVTGLNKDFFIRNRNNRFSLESESYSLSDALLKSTMSSVGLENLLRYADRNSMANSIEVRLPFLSRDLVEFAFSLPSSFKIQKGWTKWILRSTFEGLLPNEIIWRKDKVGYEGPQNDWMNTEIFRDCFEDSISNLVKAGYIIRKKSYNDQTIWKLLLLGQLIK